MPFTMIVTFQAKPGEEQRLHDELGAMIEPSLAEPGCLNYRPLVDPNQPGAMVIIEEWTGETALEEHFATPHFKRVAKVLDEILVEHLRSDDAYPSGGRPGGEPRSTERLTMAATPGRAWPPSDTHGATTSRLRRPRKWERASHPVPGHTPPIRQRQVVGQCRSPRPDQLPC